MANSTVRPAVGVLPDRGPEVAAALDVHAGGRLVEDEQLAGRTAGPWRTAAAAARRRSTCRPAGRRCSVMPARSSTSATGRLAANRLAVQLRRSRATVRSLSRPPVCITAATRPRAMAPAGVEAEDRDLAARWAGTGPGSCRSSRSCRRRSGRGRPRPRPARWSGRSPGRRPPAPKLWCTPRSRDGRDAVPSRPSRALGGCAGDCHGPIVPRRDGAPPPTVASRRARDIRQQPSRRAAR